MNNRINKPEPILKGMICHRLPERTFRVNNWYLPVCSRCTGIYMGVFSYLTYAYLFNIQYSNIIVFLAILMVLPMLFDGITQFFGFRESNNILRFITGLIAGIGLLILVRAFQWLLIVKVF